VSISRILESQIRWVRPKLDGLGPSATHLSSIPHEWHPDNPILEGQERGRIEGEIVTARLSKGAS